MKRKRKIVGNPTEGNFGNPSRLSAPDRALWDSTYDAAMKYYGDKKFAQGTAWRAVRWKQGKEHMRQPLAKLPNPSKSIILGKLIEYAYLQNPGDPRLTVVKFKKGKEPDLLWNREHKILVAFPHIRTPDDRSPEVPSELKREYQRWAQRNPEGIAYKEVPAAQLRNVGLADSVVYRSSKWTKIPGDPPGAQEYIHLYGTNVIVEHGDGKRRTNAGRGAPEAIVFRNYPPGKGKLDVLPAGIVN